MTLQDKCANVEESIQEETMIKEENITLDSKITEDSLEHSVRNDISQIQRDSENTLKKFTGYSEKSVTVCNAEKNGRIRSISHGETNPRQMHDKEINYSSLENNDIILKKSVRGKTNVNLIFPFTICFAYISYFTHTGKKRVRCSCKPPLFYFCVLKAKQSAPTERAGWRRARFSLAFRHGFADYRSEKNF